MIKYSVNRNSSTEIRYERSGTKSFIEQQLADRTCHLLIDAGASLPFGEGEAFESSLLLEGGEEKKTIETVCHVIEWLQQNNFRRDDLLIVVGGGVLTDLGGYAASSYLRGIEYVLIPTTMIAQVDAAIGGKVGVNFGSAKNAWGAFWHPTSVLIDPNHLHTLPTRDYISGLAECVKVACCKGDGSLFEFLESNIDPLLAGDPRVLDRVITDSVMTKWQLLAPDPFEEDLDRVLNLGHTTAHALEHATGYRAYRHGEAVSIGLAAAARFAERIGVLDSDLSSRILGLLQGLSLPVAAPAALLESTTESLVGVRRVRGNKLRYVVPSGLGRATVINHLESTEFLIEAFDVRH